jgi:isoquinoline 1-oxidoreductase beta subunit
MLTAVVAHPPLFGAKLKSFDAAKAKSIRGVTNVVQIPTGVAVLATSFWAAKQGRDALSVQWDESGAGKLGSTELLAQYKALAAKPGLPATSSGDVDKALAGAAKTLEASFEFPYLAHSAMEPMNCVVQMKDGACEVWNGEQFHTVDQMNVARVLGMKPEQVRINTLYAGGSFGRRANPQSDYVVEAAQIVKALNGAAPVKLQWTREDDTRAGYFRPLYYHTIAPASTVPASSSRGSSVSSVSRYSPERRWNR